jgi:hypothetical protein
MFFQDSKRFFKNPNISSNPDPNFSFRNAAGRSEITCQNFSGIYKNHTQPYTTVAFKPEFVQRRRRGRRSRPKRGRRRWEEAAATKAEKFARRE